jgi:hypothetical protein
MGLFARAQRDHPVSAARNSERAQANGFAPRLGIVRERAVRRVDRRDSAT